MKDPRHKFVTFLGIRGGDAGAQKCIPVTFWPAVLRGCGWRATHDWSHSTTLYRAFTRQIRKFLVRLQQSFDRGACQCDESRERLCVCAYVCVF